MNNIQKAEDLKSACDLNIFEKQLTFLSEK